MLFKSSTINHLYPRMNEILSGLFLGDLESSTDLESLAHHNIHHIVSILANDDHLVPLNSHLTLILYDGEQFTPKQLEKGVSFISQALERKEGVLVHCMAGISRSSSLVGAYLMKVEQFSPSEAITLLREKREIIDPAYTTFRSVINWVFPNVDFICSNEGCGNAWDYRERLEFINYAIQNDQRIENTNLKKLAKDCKCKNPVLKFVSRKSNPE